MVPAMSEQTQVLDEQDVDAGVQESTENTGRITRRRTAWRSRAAALPKKTARAARKGAGLTSPATPAHTNGKEVAGASALTSKEPEDMARKPEDPPSPSIYKLIEDDPTVPKSDFELGPPRDERAEPKPMADLSNPEEFPDDVRAVVDSAP
jgi:hypothetical protein